MRTDSRGQTAGAAARELLDENGVSYGVVAAAVLPGELQPQIATPGEAHENLVGERPRLLPFTRMRAQLGFDELADLEAEPFVLARERRHGPPRGGGLRRQEVTLFPPLDRLHRALEADLRVRAVAERLIGGPTAPAQEDSRARWLDPVSGVVEDLAFALHLVGPVLGRDYLPLAPAYLRRRMARVIL